MIKRILFLLLLVCFAGCDKNPVNKLINPTASNAVGAWNTSGDWVIYDDEMKTGGTIMMYNNLDNQVLDLNCLDNPHSGTRCIKYSWNGRDVYKYAAPASLEHDFCGFSFIASNNVNTYLTNTRDISGGAYTKISFWARGSLNSFVYLRLEGNNGSDTTPTPGNDAWMSSSAAPITSDWQQFSFNITGTMTSIKDFVKIILIYQENPGSANTAIGNGGTVYLDDIKLTH